MDPESPRVGRPRRSSPVMLEEAAAELFLEQGYDRTTIDQISARAGVARTTFFNYFTTKGDVLWVELDAAIPRLREALEAVDPGSRAFDALEVALRSTAAEVPAARVPWAVAHRALMGTGPELASSGLTRFLAIVDVITRFLARREPALEPDEARAAAAAIAGGAMAGAGAWIEAGTARGPLADALSAGVRPVLDGWSTALRRRTAGGERAR
ncbi:TetR family transcriptional regulator [Labedella populi]|uniref:TetR family transcriptional regulator n=1 Tax=Labedella populi TaxID=2498850 RepID=A0A3S4AJ40_9MICO|nr:TetR/AcrR family transcriptional regulator [Labedella populi]RWZ61214.1 TetR family transcriptional regulator [Labedella populi]